MASGSRRRGREAALQILFQIDLAGTEPDGAARLYWEHLAPGRPGEAEARAFSARLVGAALRRLAEIDNALRGISEHWRLERMSAVDRNVLRVAVAELLEDPETPRAVVLDEAIEIAKRYGGEESGHFVNGVLDALRRRLEEGREAGEESRPPAGREALDPD